MQSPKKKRDSIIYSWVTTPDQPQVLAPSPDLIFGTESALGPAITIDDTTAYQTMDGFGYTLTGGSAMHFVNKTQ